MNSQSLQIVLKLRRRVRLQAFVEVPVDSIHPHFSRLAIHDTDAMDGKGVDQFIGKEDTFDMLSGQFGQTSQPRHAALFPDPRRQKLLLRRLHPGATLANYIAEAMS